MTAITFLR